MKATEMVLLVEYVQACCPQQQIGEYTADAWHDLLGDLDLGEAKAAVVRVAKRQPFVAPAEIRAEVKRAREDRLSRTPLPAPSPELADQPGRYQRAVQAAVKNIADGRTVQKALSAGKPLPGDPPPEWTAAKEAITAAAKPAGDRDPMEIAREQVAEVRAAREVGKAGR